MKIWKGLLAGVALATMSGAVWAQNAPQPAPGARPPAGAPAQRPAGPPPTQALGDGPWDVQSWDGRLHIEVVAKGLDHPWGMAFLPDGGMLVTERPGRLRLVRNGVLDPQAIEGLPPIYATGIAGLTDIVLDPNFASNRYIYLAYSKAAPDTPPGTNPGQIEATLAVMRAKWDGGHQLTEVKDIFVADAWYGKPPLPPKCCGQGPASGSFGGRLAIGGDGKLYITSGDRNFGEKVQDPSNHFGKILRLNLDGSVPSDNPFVGREGYIDPVWAFPPSGNPGNLTVYRGSLFPKWQGDLLLANMSRPASLLRMKLDPEGHVVASEPLLTNLSQRLRDVRVGPDGAVYVLTDETAGAVLKITPGS